MNAPINTSDFFQGPMPLSTLEIALDDRHSDDGEPGKHLLQLIAGLKSHYHRQNFSHKEQFGTSDPASESALRELMAVHAEAKRWLESSQDPGQRLRLESSLRFRLVPDQS